MHLKLFSTTLLSLVVLFVLIQNVACKQDKARLNRRKVVKRQGYYTGYPGYAPATVYPPTPESYVVPYYTQPVQPAAPAAPAAEKPPANPLELGGLLSNLKLPALPTFAPPSGESNPYTGYFLGGAPKKDDDDDDEDEEDDDKNDEDADDEE
ncbi:unnamed protein product [Mucor hiemalis]